MFVPVEAEIVNMTSVVVEMLRMVSGILTPCVLAFTSVVVLISDVDADHLCINLAHHGLHSNCILIERLHFACRHTHTTPPL